MLRDSQPIELSYWRDGEPIKVPSTFVWQCLLDNKQGNRGKTRRNKDVVCHRNDEDIMDRKKSNELKQRVAAAEESSETPDTQMFEGEVEGLGDLEKSLTETEAPSSDLETESITEETETGTPSKKPPKKKKQRVAAAEESSETPDTQMLEGENLLLVWEESPDTTDMDMPEETNDVPSGYNTLQISHPFQKVLLVFEESPESPYMDTLEELGDLEGLEIPLSETEALSSYLDAESYAQEKPVDMPRKKLPKKKKRAVAKKLAFEAEKSSVSPDTQMLEQQVGVEEVETETPSSELELETYLQRKVDRAKKKPKVKKKVAPSKKETQAMAGGVSVTESQLSLEEEEEDFQELPVERQRKKRVADYKEGKVARVKDARKDLETVSSKQFLKPPTEGRRKVQSKKALAKEKERKTPSIQVVDFSEDESVTSLEEESVSEEEFVDESTLIEQSRLATDYESSREEVEALQQEAERARQRNLVRQEERRKKSLIAGVAVTEAESISSLEDVAALDRAVREAEAKRELKKQELQKALVAKKKVAPKSKAVKISEKVPRMGRAKARLEVPKRTKKVRKPAGKSLMAGAVVTDTLSYSTMDDVPALYRAMQEAAAKTGLKKQKLEKVALALMSQNDIAAFILQGTREDCRGSQTFMLPYWARREFGKRVGAGPQSSF
ncbi:hypothetical protein PoB_002013400 [Plakobranchus ocellatus]|uniref:Uncharacterized protein n=1 Tax=Plakobranchus ocellatus TaxID=259542 RepID=A0AAV3ZE41_9GAST|nr:hypothetical protein PoB_002013400 [Plakobranchus ocellatus]